MLMMLLVAKPLALGSIEAMERVLCLDVDDFGREGYALDEDFPLPVDIAGESDIPKYLPKVSSYGTVVVSDGSFQEKSFCQRVGPKLQQVFQKGGTVVILGYCGVFQVPETLNKLFGCSWKFAAYTREDFKETQHFKDHFSRGPTILKDMKSNLLAVGAKEAMYVPTTCSETFTPVAVHTGANGGRLAYFGFPNCGFREQRKNCLLLEEICCNARKPATTKFLAPCEICFTQATIKSEFKNGKSLEETACQLACSDIQKRDLPMIQVVQHSDGFMYSLDNRRLAVLRLLQLSGIIRGIKVLIIPMDERQWRKKFDPQSNHMQIRVRGVNLIIGSSLETTTFFLGKIRSARASHHAMALVTTILDEMDSDDETSQAGAGYPAGRQRKRHILQYSKAELRMMGWTGDQYLSRSQKRMTPYIPGMDSDSDFSYDDLHEMPEHLLPKSWKP